MGALDQKARDNIIKAIRVFWIGGFVLEWVFYFFYLATDDLSMKSNLYIFRRILLPFAVNAAAYLYAHKVNRTDGIGEERKKYVCAFAFCTLGGSLAIFHSFFAPLWCAPVIAAVYCSIFQDRRLLKFLSIYSCLLSIGACVYICFERPYAISDFIQTGLVTELINAMMIITGYSLIQHWDDVNGVITDSFQEKEAFRHRLETDQLTGVRSRPFLIEYATAALRKADDSHPVSIAIIDLDHFKHVNDTFGHENGDVVLRSLGEMTKGFTSDSLTFGRYGGEEFVVIFEAGTIEEHKDLLDQMRVKFSQIEYPFTKDPITFSSGIVHLRRPVTFEEAFRVADKALYRSKENGRNQITSLKI